MRVSRRSVIALSTAFVSCAASTTIEGAQSLPSVSDDELARQLVESLPRHDYYDIMLRLAQSTVKGSTGESFNSRWRSARNPLILRFFRDLGYHGPVYDNCAPWCAIALAWCLQRDGRPLPSDPAETQSYLHYGERVTEPRRGDICIFTDLENPARGHVGLFSGFVEGEKISVLGGNQKGDEETNCGPGFLKGYITFEDVEINAARVMNDNGLYLRQIRRPPEPNPVAIVAQAASHGAPAHGPPQPPRDVFAGDFLLKDGRGLRLAGMPWSGAGLPLRLPDLSRAFPKVGILAPMLGHAAGAILTGFLGLNWLLASRKTRKVRQALAEQLETGARRELEIAVKLAPNSEPASIDQADEIEAFGQEVKAFAAFLAAEFKQKKIPEIRQNNAPREVRRRLAALEMSVPPTYEAVYNVLAVKLAVVRLLNYIDAHTRRTQAYRSIYDHEVTPSLRDLLAALSAELTPEEHRLVIDTPVHDRALWLRTLLPKGRRRKAAPLRSQL